MQVLRLSTLALGLAVSFPFPASAVSLVTPPPLGAPTPSNLYGLELNQWFVFGNSVFAGTLIDGTLASSGGNENFPAPALLSRSAEHFQASGDKQASSFARVGPHSAGAFASASAPLEPLGTGMAAVGHATVSYWAVLDSDTTVTFNLKLDGHMGTTGDLTLGADRSGAAVTALALATQANYTAEGSYAFLQKAGLGAFEVGGDPLLQELINAHSTTQEHLAVFAAQSDTDHPALDVDTTLQVSAKGTRIDCDPALSPACGRYYYGMTVFLFNGAQNGGFADFSHTMEITGLSIGGAPAQPFSAISAVPEPAPALLLAAGLAGLALRRRTRR
ncbi:MAG: PEP-CTERM sorting domain-containing protein [Rubrivivax sp.]|nr:MAG: PEP-CTERM sorting domain-containing protein [Rubrivivax sp.]